MVGWEWPKEKGWGQGCPGNGTSPPPMAVWLSVPNPEFAVKITVCASLSSKAPNLQEDTRLKKNSLNEVERVKFCIEPHKANTKSRRLKCYLGHFTGDDFLLGHD